MKTMKGWHFLAEDRRLQFGKRQQVKPGEWIKAEGPLKMCMNGMHFSPRVIDALEYAPGPVMCRVEVRGDIKMGTDKGVARERRVIWMADATRTLHLFACWCADNTLALIDNPDKRSVAAIRTKRLWLDGKATDEELAAARDAAWDAAWDAARDAALAAARASAWDAACIAVWDAQNHQLTRMVNAIRDKEYAT